MNEKREREIKKFEILEKKGKDVLFIANVQAGTYIRKICSDLGDKIGGAHMLELRRTKASIFTEQTAINLYDFEEGSFISIGDAGEGSDSTLITLNGSDGEGRARGLASDNDDYKFVATQSGTLKVSLSGMMRIWIWN